MLRLLGKQNKICFYSFPFSIGRIKLMSNSIPKLVEIVEGSARMLYDEREAVFYNKVQVLNRDISTQVIRLFAEKLTSERNLRYLKKMENFKNDKLPREPFPPQAGISVLDGLAATGLRSIRYLKEVPGISSLTINDLCTNATDAARNNCISNDVFDEKKVQIVNKDATMLMYENREPLKNFDVIDIDPYGTAVPFLDAAVQAVSDGGLLCVTCTDMTVLSGNFPEVCFAKYGSMPLKARYLHEMSLRILLHSIEIAANKYKRHIVPWLSMSVDFYVRVFVRVFESPAEVKNSCMKRAMVLQSTQCPTFYLQPLASASTNKGTYSGSILRDGGDGKCAETGGNLKMAGPFWIAPIHDQEVVDELLARVEAENEAKSLEYPLATATRMIGILTTMAEELKDVPFFYNLSDLAATLRCVTPTQLEMRSALINAGYRVSSFHHEPAAIKTDAPNSVVWDIMRAYCKINPPLGSCKKNPSKVAEAILAKAPSIEVSFRTPSILRGPKKKILRFPPNPEANWGPKRRAGRLIQQTELGQGGPSDGGRRPHKRTKMDRKLSAETETGDADADADAGADPYSDGQNDSGKNSEEKVEKPVEKEAS